MLLRKSCFPLLLAVCAAGYGQERPTFEVASVKVSPPVDHSKPPVIRCSGGPGTTDPGSYHCYNYTLQGLVVEAFDLAANQFPYVPSGDHTTYDIAAKVPAGCTRDQFRTMLQNLLAERLKLVYHFEKQPAEVYDLAIAKKGAKLHESPEKPQSADSPSQDEYGFTNPPSDFKGQSMRRNADVTRWVARGATTAQMTRMLSNNLRVPVTDSTGLRGSYDFTLYYSPANAGLPAGGTPAGAAKKAGAEAAEGVMLPSLFVVLLDKLGLTLTKKQGFFDLFVVDHVDRVPVEN